MDELLLRIRKEGLIKLVVALIVEQVLPEYHITVDWGEVLWKMHPEFPGVGADTGMCTTPYLILTSIFETPRTNTVR